VVIDIPNGRRVLASGTFGGVIGVLFRNNLSVISFPCSVVRVLLFGYCKTVHYLVSFK